MFTLDLLEKKTLRYGHKRIGDGSDHQPMVKVHRRVSTEREVTNNMSFNKPYPNRKDKRKPYYGSKRFDKSCRNHGSCPCGKKGTLLKLKEEHRHDKKDRETEY